MSTPDGYEKAKQNKNIQMVRGFPVSNVYKKETIERIFDFMPRDGDVIIASYPKTGTIWISCIVHLLLSKSKTIPKFTDIFYKTMPMLETDGIYELDKLTTTPRLYRHHFPYKVIKRNHNSKIIYIYRKPEDALISFYHFINGVMRPTDFSELFVDYLCGNMSYGRYFEHVRSYLEHKEDDNILLVSYEKLCRNRKEEILKIAKFLDVNCYNELMNDETMLEKVIEYTDFNNMKANMTFVFPQDPSQLLNWIESPENIPTKEVNFFRKGIVGDSKNILNENQFIQIKQLAMEIIKDEDVLKEWYSI